MIRGIIYKYTSPSGKVYIGQTINEKDRRKHFLIQKLSYGGIKIDTARAKYNPENFKYEILETRFYMTKKAAAKELDILESYYIGLYDSYKYGYNMTLGGGKIKMNLPLVNRALVLSHQDLIELKDMLNE